MSKLSEFQIYAQIQRCESTAQMHEADGKHKLAAAARKRADEYRRELQERLDGLLRDGEQIPEQLRSVAAAGVEAA